MDIFAEIAKSLGEWQGPSRFLAIFASCFGIFWLLRTGIAKGLKSAAARTESTLDDEILLSLRWPSTLLCLLGALIVAVEDLSDRDVPAGVEMLLSKAVLVLFTIAITWAGSRVSVIFLAHYTRRHKGGREVTTLGKALVAIVWAVPAILVLLRIFKITLAPALTALGVGGLAVSLALKDTLANLFSGFYVSMAGNIHVGDYIRLDSGQEGYVTDIRWRITALRTLQNNQVVIPNSKLSEALVTNFTFPESHLALSVPLSLSYSTDLSHAERVVLEEVRSAVGLIEGLLAIPEPVFRFSPGFGDSSLNCTLVVWVGDFEKQFAVQDALRRLVFTRLKQEGIAIPFPVRTLDLAPGSLKRALDDTRGTGA